MPQIFQVLRCYKCMVFQVHQTKKSSKFQCKLCGEKQSIKRHYGIGTAKDCRMHVQRLNSIRGEIDELAESISDNADTDDGVDEIDAKVKVVDKKATKSKWCNFVDNVEETNESSAQETMYLNNTEVVLEVPKKRKKSFKCPVRKTTSHEDDLYVDSTVSMNKIQDISNLVDSFPRQDSKIDKISNRKIQNDPSPTMKIQTSVPKSCTPDTQFKADFSLSNNMMKTNSIVNGKETFIPPKVSSSKWAQFVAEEECLENDQECENDIPYDEGHELQDSEELFVLCHDNDLDDVLHI